MGPLGFEPRIANAPGWYTKPFYAQQTQDMPLSAEEQAIRRPHEEVKYTEQIHKTIEKRARLTTMSTDRTRRLLRNVTQKKPPPTQWEKAEKKSQIRRPRALREMSCDLTR